MIELLNMDCMEYLKGCEDNSFDLAIVDPPYGIGMSGGKIGGDNFGISKDYKNFHGDDLVSPDIEYFVELQRISKDQVIWGANHFIDKIGKSSPCWIVWDKDNTGNFADCELAYTSFKTAVRKFQYRWNGMLQGDMKAKEYRYHPTQKPVGLIRELISCNEGKLVLDCFMGSGTTAVACKELSRDFIGFELDKEYCDIATKRLKQSSLNNLNEYTEDKND